MIEVEKHYRTREAAALLSVHVNTMRKWIMSGEISPVVSISQTDIRIPATVLQGFLQARQLKRGASSLA